MREFIFDSPEAPVVRNFVALGIYKSYHDFGPAQGIGILCDGILEAGVVYFDEAADYHIIEMAAFGKSPNGLTKGVLYNLVSLSLPPFGDTGRSGPALGAQQANSSHLDGYGGHGNDNPEAPGRRRR